MQNSSSKPTKTNSLGENIGQFSSRDRILAAALKLFVEQGYFNTNIPDLSRESKCSVGSIYHNFKNKEEVGRALYLESLKAFRKTIGEALSYAKTTEEAVKLLVQAFMQFSEKNLLLSRYIWLCRHNEFMNGIFEHPTRVGFDEVGRKLTKFLKLGIKEGAIQNLSANLIWSVLFGIPAGYVRDWLDGHNTESPEAVADRIGELCWRALKK